MPAHKSMASKRIYFIRLRLIFKMSFDLYTFLSWSLVPLGLIRYQIRSTRLFLGFNGSLGLFVSILYLMNGALSGALVALASASAMLAQCFMGHRISLAMRLLIAVPAILIALMMKENTLVALLPLMAFSAARIAEAVRHDLGLRITLLGTSTLWMIYGACVGLPQIVAFEALGLISNGVGIWRIYGRKTSIKGSGSILMEKDEDTA